MHDFLTSCFGVYQNDISVSSRSDKHWVPQPAWHHDGRSGWSSGEAWHADKWTYSAVPLKRCQFSLKYSQKTPHSSPVRARYGVYFVNAASDWYSASVPVIIYVISYDSGARYNGTRLHIQSVYVTYAWSTYNTMNMVTHICVSELCHQWTTQRLDVW